MKKGIRFCGLLLRCAHTFTRECETLKDEEEAY